jgi:hypothetical protein
MEMITLDKVLNITGPWGVVGILLWLLIAEVRHNTELRAEMRSTADAVRAVAVAQVASLDKICDLINDHDKRAEAIQKGVDALLNRPKARV